MNIKKLPLAEKSVLVTAGSTWVPIDKVRVITNIFGGRLGIKIAEEFVKHGAHVTLLLGPGRGVVPIESKRLSVIKFRYFDDLLKLVKQELGKKQKYDLVIHSAAVSDYTPVSVFDGKIKSGELKSTIHLKPTIKIVDLIKKISPSSFLIKFKLEVGVTNKELIGIAFESMKKSQADLIVANEYSETGDNHVAYIIDNEKRIIVSKGKDSIAKELCTLASKI